MCRLILSVAGFMATVGTVSAQDKPVGKDRYGDPLPRGALARLGTTRLRHTGGWRVVDAAFSPDSKMLASFGGDNRLRLWDTDTGKELQSISLQEWSSLDLFSSAVTFSADGKTLAVSSHRKIALCDVGNAKPRLLPKHPDYITGLAFAPDSTLLVVYGYAKPVSLIDRATGKVGVIVPQRRLIEVIVK